MKEHHRYKNNGLGLEVCEKCGKSLTVPDWPSFCNMTNTNTQPLKKECPVCSGEGIYVSFVDGYRGVDECSRCHGTGKTQQPLSEDKRLAKYLNGAGKSLILLSKEIKREGFTKDKQELLSRIGSELVFHSVAFDYKK